MAQSNDPRDLLRNAGSYVERSLVPYSAGGQDAAEKLLEGIMAQFTPRVPTAHELVENSFLPWILCGQQQVIRQMQAALDNYRREKASVSS